MNAIYSSRTELVPRTQHSATSDTALRLYIYRHCIDRGRAPTEAQAAFASIGLFGEFWRLAEPKE